MEIISYENIKGIATVGFKVNDFVVYSSVPFINGESREKLLQRAYKQIKSTISYELTQDEHAFVTDETGEEFIPAEPFAERIEVEPIRSVVFEEGQATVSLPLSATVYDQYGDEYETAVEWSSTEGTIAGNELTVNHPAEQQNINVTASVEGVAMDMELTVYPYVKPVYEKPLDEEITLLKAQSAANASRADFQEEVITEVIFAMYG